MTATPLTEAARSQRLRLAHNPQLEGPGEATWPLSPRDAVMLAWLAVEGPTPRDRLASMLWPGSSETQARNSLRQRLHQLKKVVGRDLAVGTRVLSLAPDLAHDLGAATELLGTISFTDAPELDAWLQAQREQRGAHQQEALRAEAQALEDTGDAMAALPLAQRLLHLAPLSEVAHQRVMRLHYLLGDTALALVAFDRCEQTLKHELGVRPSAPTLALLSTIERAAASAAATAGAGGALPVSVLRPPALVGREPESAAFMAAWQRQSAVVLVGEAGVGKTRFVAEHTAHTRGLLRAAAYAGDIGQPYALLTRVVRAALAQLGQAPAATIARELAHLIPELGDARPLRSELDRARFLAAVDALLGAVAEAGATAVLIDDLHCADAASIEALQHAAMSQPGLAWVLVLRPEGLVSALAAWVQALQALPGTVRIDLAPLDEPGVRQLLASLELPLHDLASAAPALMHISGGKPLFVLEAVKALWQRAREEGRKEPTARDEASALATLATLSQGLAPLLAHRLRALGARALDLARCAAVCGQDFCAELAADVLQVRAIDLADAWAELEAAQVLRASAFTHDLIAEAVLTSVPQPVAAIMHAQVAAWLAAHRGKPSRIAQHFESALQPALAAPHWLESGRAAAASLRNAEAAVAFERAALGYAAGSQRTAAFEAAYEMRQASFEVDLGEVSTRAIALLDRFAATPVERARARNEWAVTALHRGDLVAAEAAALEGLSALGGANEPLVRAELRRNVAAVRLWRNDTHGALGEMRAVEHDIERLGTLSQRAMFQQSLAIVLDHADEVDNSLAANAAASTRFLELGDVPSAVQTLLNTAVTHHDRGDLRSALALLERARALQLSLPERFRSYTSMDLNFGFVLTGLGEYTQALVHLDRAVQTAREQTPGWLPLVVSYRAQLWIHLGQKQRAAQELADVEPDASTPAMARSRWTTTLGQLGADAPQGGAAVSQALATLADAVPASGRRLSRWRPQVAQLGLLAMSDAAAALAKAEALWAEIESSGRHGLAMVLSARLAELKLGLLNAEAAWPHATRALDLMRDYGPDQVYRGEVWRRCLPVLRACERARYNDELARAQAWIADAAATRVPPEFKTSFLERNPSNLAVRRMAAL